MKLQEFKSLPIFATLLPLKFETGKQRLTAFIVHCNDRNKPIPDECTRGVVTQQRNGVRSSKISAHEICAHALCPKCDRMTTANYTYYRDTTLVRHNFDGTSTVLKWKNSDEETPAKDPTFWERTSSWFKKK